MEESIKEFTKSVEIQDAIVNIFRRYLNTFDLEDIINPERFDALLDEFSKIYKSYIMKSFEDLDIQVSKLKQVEYVQTGELMLKVAGLLASKLAAELLLLETAGKLNRGPELRE